MSGSSGEGHGIVDRPAGEAGTQPGSGAERGGFSPGRMVRTLVAWLAVAVLLAVVPFYVLVRVGVLAHEGWGLGPWASLAVGVAAVSAILAANAWIVGRMMGTGPGTRRLLDRGAVAMAVAFVLYGAIWAGAANAADPAVRERYRALHPVLQVATGLIFVADPGRVVTDRARTLEDFRLLGLPAGEATLHFPGGDGFVQAVDFRTRGRPEWGNRAVELGFWLLGLHPLRHRGMADHLHVSIRDGA